MSVKDEESALCYAMRYPDLFEAFCNNNVLQCDSLALYAHYRDVGSASHLLWPCRDIKTKAANVFPTGTLPSLSLVEEDSTARPKITKIHVVVFETDADTRAVVTNQIDDSGFSSWMTYEVVGAGLEFKGYGNKWNVVEKFLLDREFDEGTYMLILDGRDTLLNFLPQRQVDAQSIIERITEMVHSVSKGNHDAVIMSGESQCCVAALTFVKPGDYFNPDGTRGQRACSSGYGECIWNGDSEKAVWEDAMIMRSREKSFDGVGAPDAFLNAGMVAGFPDSIADILKLADVSSRLVDDDPVLQLLT
jgi:hypothetical protein